MSLATTFEPLHLEVHSEVAHAASRAEWDALAGDIPFRSWDWADCWTRHYTTPSVRPLMLVVRDARQRLVGLAPLCLTRSALRGRVISFIGSGMVCSDYLSLLAYENKTNDVACVVADWLATTGADTWDRLELEGVARFDRAVTALADSLHRREHVVETVAIPSAWRIELPSTWSQYLQQLSKPRRAKVRQVERKLCAQGQCVAKIASTEAEVERGAEILRDLHQRRRQSLGQTGCFAHARFVAFHEEVMHRMFAAGRLRLHWIEYEGRPVAIEYGLTGGDTVYVYQSGFDPEFAKLKVGWMNTILSLQSAIDEGYRGYDWLRGDEPYKASWGGQKRPLVEVRVVGRHNSALFRHRLLTAGSTARRWLSGQMSYTPGEPLPTPVNAMLAREMD